jgi:rhodanese-related sulfurtransferase
MKTFLSLMLVLSLLNLGAVVDGNKEAGKTLSAKDFKLKLEKLHGVLIDVRTPEEYLCACIPGSLNINMQGKLFEERIRKLDKNKNYFLYCGTGVRSFAAMEIMKKAGFTKLFDLEGGLTNWVKYDFPMDGSPSTCYLIKTNSLGREFSSISELF